MGRKVTGHSLSRATTKSLATGNTALHPRLKRKMFQARIFAIRTKVDSRMRKSQALFRQDYDPRAHKTVYFTPNTYAFVGSPSQRANLDSAVNFLSIKEYDKLWLRAWGPFRIIKAQKHTVTIDKNGIQTTVSIDRMTYATSTARLYACRTNLHQRFSHYVKTNRTRLTTNSQSKD